MLNSPNYVSPFNAYNSYYSNPALFSSMGQIQNYNNTNNLIQPQQIPQQQNINNNFFSGSIVNSYDEVRNFPIPATGSVMLLDTINKRFYIKGMGTDGIPQIQAYFYDAVVVNSEVKQAQNVELNNTTKENTENIQNYITKIEELDKRIERIERIEKQGQTQAKGTTKKEA